MNNKIFVLQIWSSHHKNYIYHTSYLTKKTAVKYLKLKSEKYYLNVYRIAIYDRDEYFYSQDRDDIEAIDYIYYSEVLQ